MFLAGAEVPGPADTFNSSDRSAKIQKFFDTSVFSLTALGTFGTSSRNFLFGHGIQNFDAAVFKRFAFTNPLLGRLTSVRDPRIMQMARKLYL